MPNIIGLTLAGDNSDDKVFVNADNITHWCRHYKGNCTMLFLSGGTEVRVRELPWEILDRIEPEPDYEDDALDDAELYENDAELLQIKHAVLKGTLAIGERVTLHTFMHYSDGDVIDFVTEGTLDKTSDSNGIMYHYFRDGEGKTVGDSGRFGWPVHQFQSEDSE
jgi:hypothetical protein